MLNSETVYDETPKKIKAVNQVDTDRHFQFWNKGNGQIGQKSGIAVILLGMKL